jgi:hypothetical protein
MGVEGELQKHHSRRREPPSDRGTISLMKSCFLKNLEKYSTRGNRIACQCPLNTNVQGLYFYTHILAK